MKITMPKSCVSCTAYKPKGYKADSHCPHKDKWTGESKRRTQYGMCSLHNKEVFFTEICCGYNQDDLIEVVDVSNRPKPMQAHQEILI